MPSDDFEAMPPTHDDLATINDQLLQHLYKDFVKALNVGEAREAEFLVRQLLDSYCKGIEHVFLFSYKSWEQGNVQHPPLNRPALCYGLGRGRGSVRPATQGPGACRPFSNPTNGGAHSPSPSSASLPPQTTPSFSAPPEQVTGEKTGTSFMGPYLPDMSKPPPMSPWRQLPTADSPQPLPWDQPENKEVVELSGGYSFPASVMPRLNAQAPPFTHQEKKQHNRELMASRPPQTRNYLPRQHPNPRPSLPYDSQKPKYRSSGSYRQMPGRDAFTVPSSSLPRFQDPVGFEPMLSNTQRTPNGFGSPPNGFGAPANGFSPHKHISDNTPTHQNLAMPNAKPTPYDSNFSFDEEEEEELEFPSMSVTEDEEEDEVLPDLGGSEDGDVKVKKKAAKKKKEDEDEDWGLDCEEREAIAARRCRTPTPVADVPKIAAWLDKVPDMDSDDHLPVMEDVTEQFDCAFAGLGYPVVGPIMFEKGRNVLCEILEADNPIELELLPVEWREKRVELAFLLEDPPASDAPFPVLDDGLTGDPPRWPWRYYPVLARVNVGGQFHAHLKWKRGFLICKLHDLPFVRVQLIDDGTAVTVRIHPDFLRNYPSNAPLITDLYPLACCVSLCNVEGYLLNPTEVKFFRNTFQRGCEVVVEGRQGLGSIVSLSLFYTKTDRKSRR